MIDSTTGSEAATCVLTTSVQEKTLSRCPLQARSLKQLHEVSLGLMRRAHFVEIVCELIFPLKPNHQLSHFSQEIDGFRVCFVILPVQCGLDLALVGRQRIFGMILIPLSGKLQPEVI